MTDLKPALALVKRVFDVYEAVDSPPERLAGFYGFISVENMSKEVKAGTMKFWGAYKDDAVKRSLKESGYILDPFAADPSSSLLWVKGYASFGFVGQLFHVHLRYPGAHDELPFLDYLRERPNAAQEYEALKLQFKDSSEYGYKAYSEAKDSFIHRIMETAKEKE